MLCFLGLLNYLALNLLACAHKIVSKWKVVSYII